MRVSLLAFGILILLLASCRKDKLLEDSSAKLEFSTDTVFFDTVFTTVGSLTERVKIYNRHDQPIEIGRVWLKNGQGSNFKLNVDGLKGKEVKDVRIEANDSIFVFIEVTVDPNGGNTPMVLEEQLLTELNGNVQDVDLVAWGQDAYFWPSFAFRFPGDSVALRTDKPNVFYGYSLVDSMTTLIIPEGARIHFHANSGMVVGHEASLKIRGTIEDPVIIQGDRLEDYFKEKPGQWGQIVFTQTSKDNLVTNAIIKNGGIGLSVGYTLDPSVTTRPNLKLHNTQILNMSYIGLIGIDAKIEASNTIVANCGDHTVALVLGGDYRFEQCTFANYWNENPRSKPVVLLSNFSESSSGQVFKRDLNAFFGNSIVHGTQDSELQREMEKGALFNYVFDHTIMKLDTENVDNVHFVSIVKNPTANLFTAVAEGDYSLAEGSAAIDKGAALETLLFDVSADLQGVLRADGKPDLGAFEYQP
ncbi:MAG: choice-of-anchor Q domain-containing protein [Flavobacteriales bacterium]